MKRCWKAIAVCAVVLAAAGDASAADCNAQCNGLWPQSSPFWGGCYNNCMSLNREEAAPSASFGAIAYGARRTAAGWAYGKATASAANSAALSECRKHGDDCELVVSLSSGCAAVAAIESQSVFAVGEGSTRQQAESKAMNACTSRHGSGCEIEAWACP